MPEHCPSKAIHPIQSSTLEIRPACRGNASEEDRAGAIRTTNARQGGMVDAQMQIYDSQRMQL